MLNKLLSIIAVALGVLVVLRYFGFYDASGIIGYDIALIGALFLVLMQLLTYLMVHISNKGTTFMGKIIKTVFAIPGILYLINLFYPINLGFNLEIVIALFLFTEGIYGLH